MLEEIKVNDGQTGVEGQEKETPSRSEQRQKDLAEKLVEQEKRFALEKEELTAARAKVESELKDTRFQVELATQASKYPHAKDFEKDIRQYSEKGLSVEEATTLVLTKNNKLVTGQDVTRQRVNENSFGGSAPTMSVSNESDPEKMSQAERRQALEGMGTNDWKDALKNFSNN